MSARLRWVATVGTEGGPLLVANARDFARWPGALGTNREQNMLLYEGFVNELPPDHRPAPGQHEMICASGMAAIAARDAIRDAVIAHTPGVKVTEDDETLHLLLPNRHTIIIERGPASEYDASWRAHPGEATWLHTWGQTNSWQGFFWDLEGGCVVDVGVTAAREELVLVQSWVNEDKDHDAIRRLVDAPQADEERGAELTITSGHTAIVWSPTSVLQLNGFDHDALGWEGFETKLCAFAESSTPLATEMIEGLGTTLMLEPGIWQASIGSAESEDWACRWCRLKRT